MSNKIRCPHIGKNGKRMIEGKRYRYPQYDSVLDEMSTNEGVLELSVTDNWIFDTANPDYVDYTPEFWAQCEEV